MRNLRRTGPLLALTRLPTTLDTPGAEPMAPAAVAEPAIVVEHLRKTYRLPHRRYSTLKERALHPFSSSTYDELRAVDDITFSVGTGEFFGIVGRNGSGKSTLLKCLAGIYDADAGRLELEGRLSPFIELGVGFNPELTARDNVLLNAIMLGLTRRQAKDRFDDIIAFAELEEFVDLPLKNYSSGMSVRLAFAVTVEVDADVLLIDEVLAVGDAAFQQKCFEQFEKLKRDGRTIVLVTHDMTAVQRFCDRAMLIDRGRVLRLGNPHEIALAYNELNFGRLVDGPPSEDGRYGDQVAAEIKDAWFENDAGERIKELAQGQPCAMCMNVEFHAAMEEPAFAFHLRNEPRHTVFATSSAWLETRVGSFAAGDIARVCVRFDNWLAPMRYTVSPSVARSGPGADVVDLREDLASVVVHGTRVTGGIADVPHLLTVERT
jgi:ABC-type polysaccharide/polyol phosphate transport system ATPase subunit